MDVLKTIIISDLHIGNPYSNWKLLKKFLFENNCENLFLNGDIIDEHYLVQNNKKLTDEELNFMHKIINLKNTKVVYIIGNHENFGNSNVSQNGEIWNKYNIKVYKEYIYCSNASNNKYYISHGHDTIFKNPITNNKHLLGFIDAFIRFTGKLQRIHIGIIFKKGKFDIVKGVEFEILSNESRIFFKKGLKIISRFKKKVRKYYSIFHVNGIICGHLHHPEIKNFKSKCMYGKTVLYLNSGDWLENNSALVQESDGNWKIIKMN